METKQAKSEYIAIGRQQLHELMSRFIKHSMQYSDDVDWILEDMEKNGLFELNGKDFSEQFRRVFSKD